MIKIGTKIGERYEIIGNIGSGGMANVYLATDLILNREVAVKVLRFDFQNDQDAIRRFQREALAATEMVHPNIVSVYDVGEENGMQYIVMEYVKGTDLKQYIRNQKNIPLNVVVDIMGQVLSAISLAHQHRIIHRDLKPQNILVNEDGTAKITDFGIAIALSETSITQTNTLLGSVHYLSPEQARGGMATRQSDIYALGIILYELLTGAVPFEGESAVSIALKHFQKEMPSVREMNPNIPQPLENVVLRATAKETADRYATVDDMFADLKTALSPERANEAPFEPTAMMDETIMLDPIDESYVPNQGPQENVKKSSLQDLDDDDDDELDDVKKKSKRKMKIFFIVLGIILLLSGGLFVLGRKGGDVEIPDVSGKTETEAIMILQEKKIKVGKTKKVSDDKIEKDMVVKTDPPIGTSVKKDKGEVTLYISSGKKSIKMKDYEDEDVIDAKDDLLSKGFKDENIKIKKEHSDTHKANTVMKQTPKANREVTPEETKVTLFVSDGAKDFALDNMTGFTREQAMSYLDSEGLVFIDGGSEYSDNVSAGNVSYAYPRSGSSSRVKKGDEIVVIFSAGQKPAPTSSTSSSTTSTTTTETTPPETSSSVEDTESTVDSAQDQNNDEHNS
ncbi:Stk1 family PASTA domain-containing Ser/Thr kinase [Vagococcus carniphilus]|uniref:non-specific serine/threonine protein kinase n=1 Tax=Vagococcus carniphilus TaxID=218144 RepID=A0AAW8U7U5_9ENTE|nr:Stk1 family PASTA domain-containing Ser/Thr kinase [Vagococcus carniphilus]MDT2830177.1 Stk1 family PASTA domain-containing Ser/Thr kinase [Vagococcus carniphilus]MDT2833862.1 Stk1 family PASTA domain-containing Ser/Thr kinase [Vagococcus carniphilus]MDT2838609.1 Stk1 family PASTA domain-containing Ser/Thr kinase [Vagococcus carniphilus]MDT2853447.1 Stk1 family PASTA domain-containing Ser/Thr kinase [Vagococcus carniphilus]